MSMEARQKLRAPALGLRITAGFGGAMTILNLVINLMGIGPPPDPAIADFATLINVGVAVLGIAIAIIVWIGAGNMRSLTGYGMALTASILAMLPCYCGCVVGVPIGIWALIVLLNAEVKEAFQANA